MGKSSLKCEAAVLEGDVKFMEWHKQGSTQYITKWKKKYGFKGKLVVTECENLVTQLQQKAAFCKKAQLELQCAKLWLLQAKRRQEQRKAKATAAKPPTHVHAAVIKADEETHIVCRSQQDRSGPDPAAPGAEPCLAGGGANGVKQAAPCLEGGGANGVKQAAPCLEGGGANGVKQAAPCLQGGGASGTKQHETQAREGLTPHKIDIEQWATDIRGLQTSFNLNGDEMFRVFRNHFKHEWGRVRDTFTGRDEGGNILRHNSEILRQGMEGVILRTKQTLVPPPNYDKINQCRQKEGEDVYEYQGRLEAVFKAHSGIPESTEPNNPYQQHLKLALMSGFQPKYSDFIQKHFVNHSTANVNEIMNWATHAEGVIQRKKRRKI
ncbi:uncharacterized protein LOC115777893 [Archocentrus centrarchus]|uniref:uncharacterized protein LOC115777893 n=1 Tax=Archocentrus centrarchus TaxID=63155 RepID=UPI0011E9F315|nr:uncharacterized protein LOC115777893 [Archocentrus centrarchus]